MEAARSQQIEDECATRQKLDNAPMVPVPRRRITRCFNENVALGHVPFEETAFLHVCDGRAAWSSVALAARSVCEYPT